MEVIENCNGTKTYVFTTDDEKPDFGAVSEFIKGWMPTPVFIRTDRKVASGSTLWVDDMGHSKGLPINTYATEIYHSTCCIPGADPFIVGDCMLWPPEWSH